MVEVVPLPERSEVNVAPLETFNVPVNVPLRAKMSSVAEIEPTTVNSSLGVSVPIPTIPPSTNNVASPVPLPTSKPPAAVIVPEAEMLLATVRSPVRSPPERGRKLA